MVYLIIIIIILVAAVTYLIITNNENKQTVGDKAVAAIQAAAAAANAKWQSFLAVYKANLSKLAADSFNTLAPEAMAEAYWWIGQHPSSIIATTQPTLNTTVSSVFCAAFLPVVADFYTHFGFDSSRVTASYVKSWFSADIAWIKGMLPVAGINAPPFLAGCLDDYRNWQLANHP